MEKIIIAKAETIQQRIEYWKKKKSEEFSKPKEERDQMYIGQCMGRIEAYEGLINTFEIELW